MRLQYPIFVLLLVLTPITLMAQIGIGTSTPEGLLDVSMTQGFVYPRVDLINTNTATITTPDGNAPVIGTMVYNTKNSGLDATAVYPGLYQWNGTQWVAQFDKKDNKIFIQNRSLRTGHSVGEQGISFNKKTFVPQFYGTYKIKISLHFGGGKIDLPSTGAPHDQHANFGAKAEPLCLVLTELITRFLSRVFLETTMILFLIKEPSTNMTIALIRPNSRFWRLI